MRTTAGLLTVLATLSIGGGHALAERTELASTKVPLDPRAHAIKSTPGANRMRFEQKMGVRAHLRRGEHLAPVEAPELDPNAAGGALALLAGGALLFVDRRTSRALRL
jgi:hypothetical protein